MIIEEPNPTTTLIYDENWIDEQIKSLQAEVGTLESVLFQRELDMATLQGELAVFERRYMRSIGPLQAELDQLEVSITDILIQMYPDDHEIREHARHARQVAWESSRAAGTTGSIDLPRIELQERFQPSIDVKQCYREIAKLIHPDLALDEEERTQRTKLMIEANLAFQEGDEARLRAILLSWEDNPSRILGEDPQTKLERYNHRLLHIHERLLSIKREMDSLFDSDLCKLKIQVDEAETQGIDLLWAMGERLKAKIGRCKQRIRDLERAQPLS